MTEYLERLSDVRGLSKMALRRVEHLYYKNDMVYSAMCKLVQQQQAATAQQTTQTQQEGTDEAVEAEDLDEEETEAKQVSRDLPLTPHRLLVSPQVSGQLAWSKWQNPLNLSLTLSSL